MKKVYNWERYWHKRGLELQFENSFLKINDSRNINDVNNIFSFEKIDDKPCLILLGNAGLGKSTVMNQIAQELQQKSQNETEVLSFDLRLVSSESKLDNLIFHNPIFVDWINGKHKLCLFLDSFDEGLLHLGLLGDLLIENLKRLDVSRLKIRIACRTGVFPSVFEEELSEIWGKENFDVVQLAPLSAADIAEACDSWNINSEEFLNLIYDNQIQSLAGTPVMLDMLFRMYEDNRNNIPLSKTRVYEEGCRLLCDEVNPKRRQLSLGDVPIDKRMRIAMLIGAITMLCNKSLIVSRRAENGELSIDYLLSLAYDKFQYTINDVHEVLGSALFTEKEQNVYSWAHLSYAEFFAAKFLQYNKFSNEQILSLVLQSEDDNRRVIPQLHYTTAWISNFIDDVFYCIVERDPDVLCLADVAQMDDRKKEFLVNSLLERYNSCREYFRNGHQSFYKNLNHENLTSQLVTFIKDNNKTNFSKRIAIRIANECKLSKMAPDILNLAADYSYSRLDLEALHIYFQICGEENKKDSLELLNKVSNALDGLILKNLYPCYINLDSIFNYLKASRFSSDQIYNDIVTILELLSVSDLTELIHKFSLYTVTKGKKVLCDSVIDILLIHSWTFLNEEKINKEWMELAIKRFKILGTPIVINDTNFANNFKSDFTRRIYLIRETWKDDKELDFMKVINSSLSLISEDDMSDILSYIEGEVDTEFKEWLFSLLLKMYEHNEDEDSKYYDPLLVKLNSVKFKLNDIAGMKEDFNILKLECDKKRFIHLEKTNIFHSKPSRKKLTIVLEKIKKDAVRYWPKLIENIYEEYYFILHFTEYGITDSKGWSLLNESEKILCIDAACEFLLNFEKDNYIIDNFGSNLKPILGAVELVWEMRADVIETWSSSMWEKMFDYIIHPGSSSYKFDGACFRLAYAYAPEKVIKFLLDELTQKRYLGSWSGSRNIAENRVKLCGDAFFINAIKQMLNTKGIALTSRGDLYKLLMDMDSTNEAYLSNLVCQRFNNITAYKYAIEAGCTLMDKYLDGCRNIIVPLLKSSNQKDINFMILLIIRYSRDRRDYTFLKSWKIQDLVDLYIFIHINQETLNKHIGYKANEWEMRLIREFEEKNDILSMSYLFKLSDIFPDCELIQTSWERVRMTYFRESWTPPDIKTIFDMLDNLKSKPITNGKQLIEALKDTFLNFEKEMNKSENPIIDVLWNRIKDVQIPKNEETLSNLLKIYIDKDLRERGSILNREVQVFHNQGGNPGERIDIKVDLYSNENKGEQIKLYIEVKGCWNSELHTSMEEQLVKRYMLNRNCVYGIYVVGWFNCLQWSLKEDTRRGPKYSYDEAKKKFEQQALQLSKKYNVNVTAVVLDLSLK